MRISDWSSAVCSSDLEKAHIFRPGQPAICADPIPPQTVVDHAKEIGADLWLFGKDFNYSGDRLQWAYGGRSQRRSGLAYPALRGANQLLNASAALAALEALRPRLVVPQQAVRIGLSQVSLPGQTGSASCRERVCQYGSISVVAVI